MCLVHVLVPKCPVTLLTCRKTSEDCIVVISTNAGTTLAVTSGQVVDVYTAHRLHTRYRNTACDTLSSEHVPVGIIFYS